MNIVKQLPRFRALKHELAVLAQREQWSREQIESFQLKRLNQVWRHATSHVPYYRRLMHERGLPSHLESLDVFTEFVPILDKKVVREAPEQFLSDHPQPGEWHRTGGSTGVPMKVYWSHASHLMDLRTRYRADQARGVDVFDRKVFLWGHGGSMAPGWRGRVARMRQPIEDRLRSRLRLSAYRLGAEDLHRHLQAVTRFRPVELYGYSSAVYLLADEARRRGIECPDLRLVTLSAEPAHPWIVDTVRAAFNADVMVEYGSVECGVMATQTRDGTLRVREDNVLLETLERPSNDQHELVVTTLYNPSFPLIRYRIGDMTSAKIQAPARGFAWLSGVTGRDNDLLWSAQGHPVHPIAVKHAVEHHTQVRRFTARQRADGTLTLSLETDATIPARLIEHQLKELLAGYPVQVECVPRIDGTTAGKHRWVVSQVTPRVESQEMQTTPR